MYLYVYKKIDREYAVIIFYPQIVPAGIEQFEASANIDKPYP